MKERIKYKIEELLSGEYCCSTVQLNEKGIVYSVNPSVEKPYIKIMAYRNCVVVCTSENIHVKIRDLLQDKNRDEIFELPFVYGQTIHYVPGEYRVDKSPRPSDYEYRFLFGKDISSLRGLTGFDNSLVFEEDGTTSAKAVFVALDSGNVIGVAGAAKSSVTHVWEVGVDVQEGYRQAGLGTCLVNGLTKELLAKDIVPFYSASVTNIGSQMVAHRCGYQPMWVDTFGTVLDGNSVYHDIVDVLAEKLDKGISDI